jgi:hypothetical protein
MLRTVLVLIVSAGICHAAPPKAAEPPKAPVPPATPKQLEVCEAIRLGCLPPKTIDDIHEQIWRTAERDRMSRIEKRTLELRDAHEAYVRTNRLLKANRGGRVTGEALQSRKQAYETAKLALAEEAKKPVSFTTWDITYGRLVGQFGKVGGCSQFEVLQENGDGTFDLRFYYRPFRSRRIGVADIGGDLQSAILSGEPEEPTETADARFLGASLKEFPKGERLDISKLNSKDSLDTYFTRLEKVNGKEIPFVVLIDLAPYR